LPLLPLLWSRLPLLLRLVLLRLTLLLLSRLMLLRLTLLLLSRLALLRLPLLLLSRLALLRLPLLLLLPCLPLLLLSRLVLLRLTLLLLPRLMLLLRDSTIGFLQCRWSPHIAICGQRPGCGKTRWPAMVGTRKLCSIAAGGTLILDLCPHGRSVLLMHRRQFSRPRPHLETP
jgi:hypothetical protein